MSENNTKLRKALKEAIKNDGDLAMQVVGEINSYDGWFDDLLMEYFDEEFFKVYFGNNPMEAARATFFGDINNWTDDYIGFNAYGNLYSMSEFEYIKECKESADEIAEHIIDIKDDRFVDLPEEIMEIIDQYDSDDESVSFNRKPAKKRSVKKAPTKKRTPRRK